MTDQQHPITPPPELYAQWRKEAPLYNGGYVQREVWFMDRAAEWGWDQRGTINEAQLQERADQELDACCEVLLRRGFSDADILRLRAARRPKPPGLKEEALKRLKALEKLAEACGHSPDDTIRRALEALPND